MSLKLPSLPEAFPLGTARGQMATFASATQVGQMEPRGP